MPLASELPADLGFVTEAHALKLRTEDWAHDFARLVGDLEAHGIRPRAGHGAGDARRKRPGAGWVKWTAGIFAALFFIGFLQQFDGMGPGPEPDVSRIHAEPPPAAAALPSDPVKPLPDALGPLDGQWIAIDAQGRRTGVTMRQQGGVVELVSERMPVSRYPDWQAYAQRMLMQHGIVVQDIVYRGTGSITPAGLDIAIEVYTGDGRGPLDTGNLTLVRGDDGRQLEGSLWSNGAQAQQPIRMLRP